ncbi:hypothetical protein Tco_0911594 [Tanacetum coccineum]|uniref:Uncharacterized protein n=1 Tax=Tanacetum coccineum TaxID=301880 RepID=A0ABQ5D2K4_9ASTR
MDEDVSLELKRLARKRSSKKQWVHRESVSKQGRNFAKDVGRTRDVVDEEKENDEDALSTEDVLSTAQQKVNTDKEKVSTDRPIVSTNGSKVSTDRQKDSTDEQSKSTNDKIEGTDEQSKGIDDHTEEGSATQTTQPPTSTIFGDDETIAQITFDIKSLFQRLIQKQKEEKIEEEDESESESDGIPEAKKKFKQLASDEEMARKVQEEWEGEEERKRLAEEEATNEALIRNYDDIKARIEADRLLAEELLEEDREHLTIEKEQILHDTIHVGNFKHSDLKTKKFEEIQALYEKIKRSDEDFISIGSAEDERLIKKMNEKGIDSSKNEMVKEESKEEESTRKRKLGTRKKMKSRKRRFRQNTSEDDSEKENDELRLCLTIASISRTKELIMKYYDKKYPL